MCFAISILEQIHGNIARLFECVLVCLATFAMIIAKQFFFDIS